MHHKIIYCSYQDRQRIDFPLSVKELQAIECFHGYQVNKGNYDSDSGFDQMDRTFFRFLISEILLSSDSQYLIKQFINTIILIIVTFRYIYSKTLYSDAVLFFFASEKTHFIDFVSFISQAVIMMDMEMNAGLDVSIQPFYRTQREDIFKSR